MTEAEDDGYEPPRPLKRGDTVRVVSLKQQGVIADAAIYGDFMATASLDALSEALCGVRPERSELEAVLSRFDCASLFGGITREEVVGLMTGEGDENGSC